MTGITLALILLASLSRTVCVVAAPTTNFNHTTMLQQRQPFAFGFLNFTIPPMLPTIPRNVTFRDAEDRSDPMYLIFLSGGLPVLLLVLLIVILYCCLRGRKRRQEQASQISGPNQELPVVANERATSDESTELRTIPSIPKHVGATVEERAGLGYQDEYDDLTNSTGDGPHVADARDARSYLVSAQREPPSYTEASNMV